MDPAPAMKMWPKNVILALRLIFPSPPDSATTNFVFPLLCVPKLVLFWWISAFGELFSSVTAINGRTDRCCSIPPDVQSFSPVKIPLCFSLLCPWLSRLIPRVKFFFFSFAQSDPRCTCYCVSPLNL